MLVEVKINECHPLLVQVKINELHPLLVEEAVGGLAHPCLTCFQAEVSSTGVVSSTCRTPVLTEAPGRTEVQS